MKKMLAVILLIILLSSGCLSPVSLDAYGYVISIGIGRGTEKKYYFTFALQRELSEQNIDSEGGAVILSAEADGIFEAVSEMEGNIPYSLNFSRTNFVILERELAEEGVMEDFVSTSFDALKIRTSTVLIVSEGPAHEFIGGMYSNNEANIGKLQSALMLDREKTGTVTVMSISRLIEACSDGRYDYCTSYGKYDGSIITDAEQKKSESEGKNPLDEVKTGDRVGGLKSFVEGAAVFSGWKMTGVLDSEETMLLNIVTGDFENGVLSLDRSDGSRVSVLLSRRKRDISADENLGINVHIVLDAGVIKKDPDITASETDAWLTEKLPEIIRERLLELFLKLRGIESDAMRFGTALVKNFDSTEAWESFETRAWLASLEPVFTVEIVNTEKYIGEDMQ